MTKKTIFREAAAFGAVALVLAGLPLLLWYWRAVAVPGRYPRGTKVIHLTAIADGGIWTEEAVAGFNYWWRKPAPATGIALAPNSHVVLLLHSSDVQHAFVMRDLHIGPVPVAAGHTAEVEFDTRDDGPLSFICMQVCGKDHNHMGGSFLVAARGGKANEVTAGGGPAMPEMRHSAP